MVGAPLSAGSALDSCLEDKISKLRSGTSRLRLLSAQKAQILLRSLFTKPRLMHVLRYLQCFAHLLLQKRDKVPKEALSTIVSTRLTHNGYQPEPP